jgi:flavin-dependent dehydrogenase
MTVPQKSMDHLVIGGGLAGSMVAIRLAAAGRRVTLLEKERSAHHKVCGEFLSREAIEYLRQAGVDPLDLGAVSIGTVRLSSKQTVVEATLQFPALSLSRRTLDEAMLARAAASGCTVERGVYVDKLTAEAGVWTARLRDGGSLRAQTVFLANGKHDLRGWDRTPTRHSDMVGFKMHWQLAPAQIAAMQEVMELFLIPGGYGGLALVEQDIANLCLVVKRTELRRLGGWVELLTALLEENQHMRQRMQGANPLWERPLAISSIPYGYFVDRRSGLWGVGDQSAVIPSFTGDGMSIALHSAALAAQSYLAGENADNYHRQIRVQLRPRIALATYISQAIVTGMGRKLAPTGLSLFPGVMQWIAASTRIPTPALLGNVPRPL